MKNINAIIIDDEPRSIELLTHLLKSQHKEITILATGNSAKTGQLVIEEHIKELDILFLDIEMQDGDGFSLLQSISDIRFKVIFTTAYNQFALRAIKFSALDYLLKPIDNKELSDAIDKFKAEKKTIEGDKIESFKTTLLQQKTFEKLTIATLTDIRFISLHKILYMESDNNYSTIYLDDNQRLVTSKNIGYYEELLEASNFLRINNSNLVNLAKITRFVKGKTGSIELEGGKTLQVSASKKEKLLKSSFFN